MIITIMGDEHVKDTISLQVMWIRASKYYFNSTAMAWSTPFRQKCWGKLVKYDKQIIEFLK